MTYQNPAQTGTEGQFEPSERTPVVELQGITKRFPGVLANDDIHLAVEPGEVLCLLGENGAGKSTLMSILSGMQSPDEGAIYVNGEQTVIADPRQALDLGIGMVYQHSTLVPTLSVIENLMLGASEKLILDASEARERLEQLAGMLGAEVDPHARAGDLALGQQQVVEIIKALWKGTTVLILDEPTSMLTPRGIDELAKMIDSLKEHGLAVIFITHKLHEALRMGDGVCVLRQGRVAGRLSADDLRSLDNDQLQERIVSLMFGDESGELAGVAELSAEVRHESGHDPSAAGSGRRQHAETATALRIRGVSLAPVASSHGLHDIDLELYQGEILGVAGVDGNGQRELAEVIAGQRDADTGAIVLHDGATEREVTGLGISSRQRLGLRYLTDERHGEGTVRTMPIGLNLLLKRIGQEPFWKRGAVQNAAIRSYTESVIEAFDVRAPGPDTPIGKLSGGNMQKVLLARELAFEPRVVVYNKPTYGLDVRTTQAVRLRIREQAERGVAALVMSTSLDELLEISDRIAVMSRGRVVGVVENGPGAEERIGEYMVGEVAA